MAVYPAKKCDVPKFLLAAFPEYKGRKFQIITTEKYHFHDYWSEGSRGYAKVVSLKTHQITSSSHSTNPFNRDAHLSIDITDDFCVVEHEYSCGRDLGLRFYLTPTNATRLQSL